MQWTPNAVNSMHLATDEDKKAYQLGICVIHTLELASTSLTCINILGWAGGHTNLEAAQAKDDLLDTCLQ